MILPKTTIENYPVEAISTPITEDTIKKDTFMYSLFSEEFSCWGIFCSECPIYSECHRIGGSEAIKNILQPQLNKLKETNPELFI